MTKIIDALREKYRTPQAALRALGLDESLLREDETKPMRNKDEAVAAVLTKALAQDASLAEMTEFLKALNASGNEGAAEEGGEYEDEDGEDEVPPPITEPNAGVPQMAKEDGEGEHTEVATDEPAAAIHAILKDKCTPEELARIGELLEKIATPEGDADNGHEGDIEGAVEKHTGIEKPEGEEKTEGEDEDTTDMSKIEGLVTKPAMDEAIKAAVAAERIAASERATALRSAERAVEPYVGKLAMDAAMDAEGVYRKALAMLGVVGVEKVREFEALPILLRSQPLPGSNHAPRREHRMAQDAAADEGFAKRFPRLASLVS